MNAVPDYLLMTYHLLEKHVPEVIQKNLNKPHVNPEAFFHEWWHNEARSFPCFCTGLSLLEKPIFGRLSQRIQKEILIESGELFRAALDSQKRLTNWWRDDLRMQEHARNATETLVVEDEESPNTQASQQAREVLLSALNSSFLNTLEDLGKFESDHFNKNDAIRAIEGFVIDWVKQNLGFDLDSEQAAAVAAVSNHTRIVARAGSGKTSVMAIRAVFLVEHCHAHPSELLLMAFNRSAKQELQTRIAKLTLIARGLVKSDNGELQNSNFIENLIAENQIELPWVATFDSVARSIANAGPVEKREQVLLDETGQKRLIDQISRNFLKDPEKYSSLKKVMLQHFKDDWDKLLAFEESMVGSFHNELPKETLLGEQVKSFGEKRIADWLFSHEVEYKYEKSLWLDEGRVFPDFTVEIGSRKLIIEYLGMQGDYNYDRTASLKSESYKKKNIEVLELTREHISSGQYEVLLSDSLKKCFGDLTLKQLSMDALWTKIQNVSESRFRKNVSSFVGRVRRSRISAENWKQKSHEILSDDAIALGFTKLALEICEIYEQQLQNQGLQDFIGVMIDAIEHLKKGQSFAYTSGGRERRLSDLKFICMDEYQDFSNLYEELVEQLVRLGNKPLLFAVGDNWQSINSFMGAEPKLFEGFERKWPDSASKNITGNYRSAKLIVETGNSVMQSSGETPGRVVKAEVGRRVILKSDELQISPWERETFEGDEKSAGIVRIIQTHLRQWPKDEITLLTRTNSVPWWFPGKSSFQKNLDSYLEFLKRHVPLESHSQLAISTVNSFKGLESSAVIILDALDVSFPLIHKDSRFMSLFGIDVAELLEEERRLFYVATTRPRSALYILTREGHESRFIEPFLKLSGDWNLFTSDQIRGSRIICRGSGTFEIKDALKEAKFEWDAASKEWSASIPKTAINMSPEEIIHAIKKSAKPWVYEARMVDVEVVIVMEGREYKVPI